MTGLPTKSYGRDLLEKYGWTEGKGLGKTENGMVEALKPKLKCDNAGIGHDHAELFTLNWWEMAFNEAAKRVSVNTSKTDSNLQMEDSFSISTKRPWVAKMMKENPLKYGKFIKTETLVKGGETVPVQGKVTLSEADECSKNELSTNLSDDELLKICGGRTAHKAARHGHKLVGKLARVIEQEKKHAKRSAEKGESQLEPASQVIPTANGWENVRKKKRKEAEENCAGGEVSSEGRRKKRKKKSEVEEDSVGGEPQCAANCDAAVSGTLESVVVGGEESSERQGRMKKKRKKSEVEDAAVSSTVESVGGEESSERQGRRRKKKRKKSEVEDAAVSSTVESVGGEESSERQGRRRKKKRKKSEVEDAAVSGTVESVVVGGEVSSEGQGSRKKKKGKHLTELPGTNGVTNLMGSKRKKHHCE